MTDSFIIETDRLARDYKTVRTVDGLDLSIEGSELFGLVDSDGTGKITTLRLLAGLLDISDGNAFVLGFDLKEKAEAIKLHIGYMAQQFSLYAELSVLENLQFFAQLFDVSSKGMVERTERFLTFAGLTEFKKCRAANLSSGMHIDPRT